MRIGPDVQLLRKLKRGWYLAAVTLSAVLWTTCIGLII
jgi:hypothetical protein